MKRPGPSSGKHSPIANGLPPQPEDLFAETPPSIAADPHSGPGGNQNPYKAIVNASIRVTFEIIDSNSYPHPGGLPQIQVSPFFGLPSQFGSEPIAARCSVIAQVISVQASPST